MSVPRPGRGAIAPAVLVVLALGAALVTGLRSADRAATEPTAATGGFVQHSTLACPDAPVARGTRASAALGLAPAARGLTVPDGGAVTVGPVTSDGRPMDVPRGSLRPLTPADGPAADATGGSAAGLFGYRVDAGRTTLGVTTCPAPRAQWWFTGAGAGLDHSSSLLLANLDPGPAVLDIAVLGPDGPVDTVATEGITLAPHSVRAVPLADIAPQTDDLAVSVRTSRGRVVASVDDGYAAKASAGRGQEWLAGTDLPSRTLRLDGISGTADTSTLLVANPSDLEAVVRARVAGKSGTFTPEGLDAITVAPGAIKAVDLSKMLPAHEPVALRLRSRVPVVASVRTVESGRFDDHAYATPVAPLAGPAAAPLVPGADASVQLTAGAVASTATLTAYDAKGGRVDSTTLDVAATATATWSPRKGGAYVVVEPTKGRVHGAVTYTGDGVATVPLVALPFRVERPTVRPGIR